MVESAAQDISQELEQTYARISVREGVVGLRTEEAVDRAGVGAVGEDRGFQRG